MFDPNVAVMWITKKKPAGAGSFGKKNLYHNPRLLLYV